MDREAWRAAVHGVAKSRTRLKQLSSSSSSSSSSSRCFVMWDVEKYQPKAGGDWLSIHFLKLLKCLSSVQLLSCVRLFATPWTAARQASLSITNS